MKNIKIAINCSYFVPKGGGVKEYIYNLVSELSLADKKYDFIFYVLKDQVDYWKETFGHNLNYKIIPFNKSQRIKLALLGWLFWLKEQKKENFDIFHSPFFHIPYGIKCKKIITVHDLRFMRYPNTYEKIRLIFLKYIVPKSLKRADLIISISNFTKNEIINFFNVPENKIVTIHEAINLKRFNDNKVKKEYESFILKKYSLCKKKYILSVGHLEPRKNYNRLIEAFIELNIKDNIKLVIIGKFGLKYEQTLNLISNNNNISLLNFVTEDELIVLYKNAYLFAFPSYYEGFGFPPLEAAAFGVPSVVSNVSSLPEVCGRGAYYFNPLDKKDISLKIKDMIDDTILYNEIKNSCSDNLRRFSWKKNVQETITQYEKVISQYY